MKPMRLALAALVASCPLTSRAADPVIHVNQAGYHPAGVKRAVVVEPAPTTAALVDDAGAVVFEAELSAPSRWPHAAEDVRVFDFSAARTDPAARYRVRLPGGAESPPFTIRFDLLEAAGRSALRSFYLLRSGTALPAGLAGPWARAAGHPDTEVYIHESAAGPVRAAGDVIASPGGWYDAGDYNKYVVNSSITVYFMLLAAQLCPDCVADGALGIPESGNGRSDLLDEVRFNLDWMLTMQDPADGGVYHKLTTKRFGPMVMPAENRERRYVVQKSTAATLDLAAVAAYASRAYRADDPEFARRLLDAARRAWDWAGRHPAVAYRQPADVATGTYARAHDDFADEWGWARVELFLATGEARFLAGWDAAGMAGGVPDWSYVMPLGWLSLVNADPAPDDLRSLAQANLLRAADVMAGAAQTGYRVTIGAWTEANREGQADPDWVWGSNGVAAVHVAMLVNAWRISGQAPYLEAATGTMDYLLGRNPNGISYLTGTGARHTMNLHSRPSVADGVEGSLPGLLAGGPHNGHEDRHVCDVDYVHPDAPAKSYLDDSCSFATNENAINWNGAFVAAAFLLHDALSARAGD